MTLRTVIVEDELPSLNRLKELLENIDHIELVGCAQDGEEAVKLINETKPDLALLDIQLPVFTSFEVLNRLKHRPNIIFITAYDQYAIKAFEENAVDYLLKPTSADRLTKAIKRVDQNKNNNLDLVSILKDALKDDSFSDRFSIKLGDQIIFVHEDEVLYFHAEDKYVFLNTENDKYIVDLTLKDLTLKLDPEKFLRTHKSYIIAIDKIKRIKRTFPGKYKIQLAGASNVTLEIGRTFLPDVRNRLEF